MSKRFSTLILISFLVLATGVVYAQCTLDSDQCQGNSYQEKSTLQGQGIRSQIWTLLRKGNLTPEEKQHLLSLRDQLLAERGVKPQTESVACKTECSRQGDECKSKDTCSQENANLKGCGKNRHHGKKWNWHKCGDKCGDKCREQKPAGSCACDCEKCGEICKKLDKLCKRPCPCDTCKGLKTGEACNEDCCCKKATRMEQCGTQKEYWKHCLKGKGRKHHRRGNCKEMCAGLSKEECIKKCTEMGKDKCAEKCRNLCKDNCKDMFAKMGKGKCREICGDKCKGFCKNMCAGLTKEECLKKCAELGKDECAKICGDKCQDKCKACSENK